MGRFATRLKLAVNTNLAGSDVGWTITTQNVGLASLGIIGTSLPLYTGSGRPANGTVISDRHITDPLDLSLGNITIERCLIRPTAVGQGLPVLTTNDNNTFVPVPATVTIRDCDIDGSLLDAFSSAMSTGFIGIGNLINNYIHGFGSGIALFNAGTQFDSLIERNYVRGLTAWGDPATTGNHSDAFTIRDFTNSVNPARQAIIRNNRFDCDSPNATGAFFIQTYAGNINNVLVEGNLLEGGGYQLVLEEHSGNTYSNMSSINNRMSATGYGPGYVSGGPGWAMQSENYRYVPGNPDGKGLPVFL